MNWHGKALHKDTNAGIQGKVVELQSKAQVFSCTFKYNVSILNY